MMLNIQSDYGRIHFFNQDYDGLVLFANKVTMDFFGAENESDFIGKSLDTLHSQEGHVEQWISNSRAVMQDKAPRQFIDSALTKTGKIQWFRTYRAPLYGHRGNVLGIHGLSIPVSEQSLIPLTNRQTACLCLLAKGLTHKQIGLELGLAAKTVEHYLDAVKLKLNCESRSDLIMQAIERGLVGVF